MNKSIITNLSLAFLTVGAIFTALIVSRYFTMDPEVYFPEQRDTYQEHATALLLHVGGGFVAILLGPFQFMKALRNRYLTAHRISGRVYALACVVSATAGLAMATRAYGGFAAGAGFASLSIVWLITIIFAVTRARQRRIPQHREWMIRSFALTLAAFSLRMILMAHGIATELEWTSLPYVDMYRATAWLCWVPNLLIAEWYINVSRRSMTA